MGISMKVKYNIPKKFPMGGQVVKVEIVKQVEPGVLGKCFFFENMIKVGTHLDGKPVNKEQVEQTFWHEFCHYLFFQARQDELCYNEPLVDLLGEFLYQSLGKAVKWR